VQLVLEELGYSALADLFVLGLVSQHKATSKSTIILSSPKSEATQYTNNTPHIQQHSLSIITGK
jgi:hypothetical protein